MNQSEPQPSQPDDADALSESLKAELRAIYSPPTAFPAQRDAELLGRIRRQHSSSRWRSGRWMLAGAVAATVALTAGAFFYFEIHSAPAPASPVYARTGDIRDAFYLARQLKSHQQLSGNWDENHDGVVDQADVRALAMAAVRIDRMGAYGEGGTR